MSAITGADRALSRLETWRKALDARLGEAVETAARQMQADLVDMAPVKEGDLKRALASPDALRVRGSGRRIRAEVGFLTSAQKRQAFHAFFVEFGTKGYVKGARRYAGKRKGGRERWNKVRRDIPARPAHPFFRPAMINLKRNLERLRAEAHARALADAVAGRMISDAVLD